MNISSVFKALIVVALIAVTSLTVSAAKKADSEFVKSARSADIANTYGTWSIMLHESYGGNFIFQTFRGHSVDKEFQWNNLSFSIGDKMAVIKGMDAEGNDCKMTIEQSGKQVSIWVEVSTPYGRVTEDFGIREIGGISFATGPYDYRSAKNVKTGFKLLKEWLTAKYL